MKLLFNTISCLLFVEAVFGQQCSLCPGGSGEISNSQAKLGTSTCGKVESQLNAMPNAACTAMKLTSNFYFDYSAFCCNDVSTPAVESCQVCPPGFTILQDDIHTPTNNLVETCGEVKVATFYAEEGPACTVLLEAAVSCCEPRPETNAPTKTPTAPPTPHPVSSGNGSTQQEGTDSQSQQQGGNLAINAAKEQEGQKASGAVSYSITVLGAIALVLAWAI